MFKFKMKLKDPEKSHAEMRKRVTAAVSASAEIIAENVVRIARSKIPTGGWYDLYRRAIEYFVSKDGLSYAAAGRVPIELRSVPAATSLVRFDGAGPIADVMMQFSPWAVDTIPAITRGYLVSATVRPASEADVNARREAVQMAMPNIVRQLKDAGASILPDTFPVVQGKVYADMAFMATALEHGLAGLKRVPHWVVAYQAARRDAPQWMVQHRARIQSLMAGEPSMRSSLPQMPPELEQDHLQAP